MLTFSKCPTSRLNDRGNLRNAVWRIALGVSVLVLLLCFAHGLNAQTFADVIRDARDYKLEKVGDQTPNRVMDFTFFETPTYTRYPAIMICGDCLCVTGVFTRQFPELGIRPTSGSPTYSCEWGSTEFEQDEELAAKFMEVTRVEVQDTVLTFSSDTGEVMIFRMRTDMESCLNWFSSAENLEVRNICDEPVQIQLFAPKLSEVLFMTVAAKATFETGRKRVETEGFVYSACPVNMEPSAPFDASGYARIKARDYECN